MTILLVDDHPIVREGLTSLLLRHFPSLQVRSASSATDALHIMEHEPVNIAVLDLELKEESGLKLCSTLQEMSPQTVIIVYTMHEEPWTVRQILKADPDAVVVKSDPPSELLRAVTAATAGNGFYSASFVRLMQQLQLCPSELSERELEVLRHTANGLSAAETARKLGISANTVEFHRRRIMKKLSATNVAMMIQHAHDLGLLLPF